ncbi:MAG: ubiquitin-like small modifier protein 1 [Thermoanaerobaculia bacterium]
MSRATVRIPTPLRAFTGGATEVAAEGSTVGDLLRSLSEAHPGLKQQILTEENEVRDFVNIFVDDKNIRSLDALESPVKEGAIIHIVPAVAGGES